MLRLLKEILADMKSTKNQKKQNNQSNNDRDNDKNPCPTSRCCYDTSKYCWMHGACSYPGKEYRKKKDGHKDKATFQNMMGGITFYCRRC